MRVKNNQKGVVSLLTVVILSLLILVFVIGMTVIVIGLQRQATNANLSLKAYYAAQTGVEDAVLKINTAIKAGQPVPYSSDPNDCAEGPDVNGAKYVCQTITHPGNGEAVEIAESDETNQYEISAGDTLTQVVIEWNKSTDDSTPTDYPNNANFPSTWNFPAAIELTDIAYETTSGGVITGTPTIRTTLLEPINNGTATSNIGNPLPDRGRCISTGTYNCTVTISGFDSALNHIVRIRPRYAKTSFKVGFYQNATGTLIASDVYNKATIDVTAKAGDVLRAVQATVSIKSGTLSGLDYALFGDSSICKAFSVNVTSANEQANTDGCPLN